MSERWTHSICAACYAKLMPGREPVRLKDPGVEVCCYCGEKTIQGIFVRWDPARVACQGRHHAEGQEPAIIRDAG